MDVDLLLLAVYQNRRGCPDPFVVPAHVCERLGFDHKAGRHPHARRAAQAAHPAPGLLRRQLDPRRTVPLATDLPDPAHRPEDAPDRVQARAILQRMAARRGIRIVIADIYNVAAGRRTDPVRAARRFLGLDEQAAEKLVRRLVTLVAAANLGWTDDLTRAPRQGR